MVKKAIVLVIDSMGIGAMSDCEEFSDSIECNTLGNVAKSQGGIYLPNLGRMGLGNILPIMGVKRESNPQARYGIMLEKSKGKCTTTGHWEMMGLVLDKPFKTYPKGFDREIIEQFVEMSGCGDILGNYPASGTKIIQDLNAQHQVTKYPIVYTSADSVFQIAVDVEVVSIERLYKWCEIARQILGKEVSRVIARPYRVMNGRCERISSLRRDYSVKPYRETTLDILKKNKVIVLGIGKIEDIFVKQGITHAIHTGSNREGLELTIEAIEERLNLDDIEIDRVDNPIGELIFTNLVDTDMLYGHRNDALGYKKALEEIDEYIGRIERKMSPQDLLIITADHGCDPTILTSTDHTREKVPILIYSKQRFEKGTASSKQIPTQESFELVGKTVLEWFKIGYER